ncbi:MAG TPA: OmpA family protein [Burkholderiales bacterium]|nr:OmpA family protein [Burkholderiales bacterium]
MKGFFSVCVLFPLAMLAGCSTVTTWILLPDQSGKVGAITVKTDSDFRLVDQAYESAVLKPGTSTLALAAPLSSSRISREYRQLLQAEPQPSTSFMLYFKSGSTELVRASLLEVPELLERIKSRLPTEITLIGHTDTTGPDTFNDQLSLRRAQAVEKILRSRLPGLDAINVQYFGAKNLLVPTPPNVEEQRNRAVEILIL